MVEPSSDRQPKMTSSLRRQHSLMEQRSSGRWRSSEFQHQPQFYDDMNVRQRAYDDQYYDDRGNYMNQPNRMYDNDYDNRSQNYYEQENLYANRALIELERQANENRNRMPYQTGTGTRIVRRHSMADRTVRASPLISPRHMMNNRPDAIEREEIYQTRSGAFMMQQTNYPGDSKRARSREEDPVYQSRREMHRDHLYQSKKEMQQRIYQSRMEVERSAQSESPSLPSSSSTATTPIHSDHASSPSRELIYQSRRELKEKGFKTRTQLRDHIYQSRREAMETMAEPSYSTKRVEIQRHQEPIIYESKENDLNETTDESPSPTAAPQMPINEPNLTKQTQSPHVQRVANRLIAPIIANQNSCNSSGLDDDDTINSPNQSGLQKTVVAAGAGASSDEKFAENEIQTQQPPQKESVETEEKEEAGAKMPLSPRADRAHISNIIKRVASPPTKPPPPPTKSVKPQKESAEVTASTTQSTFYASRTSIETQYTSSQISLPIGPPNAQSTPYASEAVLPSNDQNNFYPPLREQTTTRGTFDENGGTLCDNLWNVSISIPKGAIPAGIQQEIYFTVTDPRLSQTVGGPPLDMENGWCYLVFFLYIFLR